MDKKHNLNELRKICEAGERALQKRFKGGCQDGEIVDLATEQWHWKQKTLTKSQQDVVGGILCLLEEMANTAKQVNIQVGAFGIPLPRLVMHEVDIYFGDVYRLVKDAETAAGKTGSAVVIDRLVKAKEFSDLRSMVIG